MCKGKYSVRLDGEYLRECRDMVLITEGLADDLENGTGDGASRSTKPSGAENEESDRIGRIGFMLVCVEMLRGKNSASAHTLCINFHLLIFNLGLDYFLFLYFDSSTFFYLSRLHFYGFTTPQNHLTNRDSA